TFFNGYDGFVLPFVLSLILADLGGSQAEAGLVNFVALSGSIVAFFLAAQADRIGRRRLLLITITGYTLATILTAVSVNLAMLTAMLTLGGILVGILAFAGLASTPLSWRAFYLVGLIPLAVVAILRRRMHETARYSAVRAADNDGVLNHTNLLEPWRPQYRR